MTVPFAIRSQQVHLSLCRFIRLSLTDANHHSAMMIPAAKRSSLNRLTCRIPYDNLWEYIGFLFIISLRYRHIQCRLDTRLSADIITLRERVNHAYSLCGRRIRIFAVGGSGTRSARKPGTRTGDPLTCDRPPGDRARSERKNSSVGNRALAASEKAGGILLREAERTARVALGQAATGPRTAFDSILAYGPRAKTIARQAQRLKSDLIMIGSRGLSDIKGFLLGSISRQVASIAPCPVFVVKQPTPALIRVALAVDDSKHSRAAARFLRSRILPDSATVTILSSAESPVTDLAARYLSQTQLAELTRPVMERATALVNGLRNEFIKDGYLVVTKVYLDHVIDTIVKHVESEHDKLLVLGSRALSKSERLHLGSVSESLLKYAPCSILIVRGVRA